MPLNIDAGALLRGVPAPAGSSVTAVPSSRAVTANIAGRLNDSQWCHAASTWRADHAFVGKRIEASLLTAISCGFS